MKQNNETTRDRTSAGESLVKRIADLRIENAVVVGIPRGGVCVASVIAERLGLPLEVMSCKKVKDPSNQTKDIGSVSASESCFHDYPYDVPQDYLYFRTVLLRNEIRHEHDFYYGNDNPVHFEDKTVIVVDDLMVSTDELSACLCEIRNQEPLRIILAVPFAQSNAVEAIRSQVDDLVVLKSLPHIRSPHEFYERFPVVDDWTVRRLLQESQTNLAEPVSRALAGCS